MHKLITVGDEEATDDVMQEVFRKSSMKAGSSREAAGKGSMVIAPEKCASVGNGRLNPVGWRVSKGIVSVQIINEPTPQVKVAT